MFQNNFNKNLIAELSIIIKKSIVNQVELFLVALFLIDQCTLSFASLQFKLKITILTFIY
jgi:hypothetical protein